MKKITIAILCIAVVAGILTGCGSKTKESSKSRLEENKKAIETVYYSSINSPGLESSATYPAINSIKMTDSKIIINGSFNTASSRDDLIASNDSVISTETKEWTFEYDSSLVFQGYNGYEDKYIDYSFAEGKETLLSQNGLEVVLEVQGNKVLSITFYS